MNDKMSQAITAARSGQSQKAQVLLAQILKEDQTNVNAWFLLSHLVDAPEKKTAFLKRVITLDPQHQKAQQALASIKPKDAIVADKEQAPVPEPITASTPEPISETQSVAEEQETAYQLAESSEEPSPTPIIAPDIEDVTIPQATEPLSTAATSQEDLLEQAESNTLPSWLTDSEADDVLSPEALAAEALPDFTESVAIEDLPDWLTKTNIDDWTAEKPWEQAEENLDFDLEDELPETFEETIEPEPKVAKSVVEVAAEEQKMAETTSPSTIAPPKKRTSDRGLNVTLSILIIIAVIVLVWLLYIVITSLG